METAKNHVDAQRKGYEAFFVWVKNRPDLYSIVQQAVVVDEELYRWYYRKLADGFLKSLTAGVNDGEFKDLHKETVAYSLDRKSTRLNSSHVATSYAVFCLKKKTCASYQITTSYS